MSTLGRDEPNRMSAFSTRHLSARFLLLLLVISSVAVVIRADISGPGSGLVGHWSFDDGGGATAGDASGSGFAGNLQNGPQWVPGRVGSGALSFDGVNDYVEVPGFNGITGSSAATIAFWVYPTATDRAIISQWNTTRLFEINSTTTRLVAYWRYGGSGGGGASLTHTTPANTLSLYQWQHIAFIYRDGTSSFYRNGVLVNSVSGGGVLNAGVTGPLRIGWNNRPSYTSGSLDDVHIYNRALLPGEVQDLYNAITVPDTESPSVSISTPVGGSVASSAVTVAAGAVDNIAVAGVQFKIDGANLGAEDQVAPYAVSWDTTGVPNGEHVLTAVARDAASNTGTAPPVSVTVFNLPIFTLTVSRTGSGSGTVASDPTGIDCGADCGESVAEGTQLTLHAVPNPNATFDGWSGACGGTLSCQITVSENTTVTALFTAVPGTGPPSGQAYEWGYNNQISGRAAGLAQLSDAVLMSANSNWSLALKADGRLVAWGYNVQGQTNVPSGLTDRFVHAAAGWQHGIACRPDGTVEEWGNPYGNTEAQWEARRPPINNCVQVAAGDDHSAALLADGTVVTWGGRKAVTKMSGVITDATQIASGWYAVIVLRRDGTVTVFGAVSNPGEYLAPPPGLSNVVRVAASPQASFYAIRADGTLVAWGSPDTYGQLTPPPSATNLIDVAGGRYHTLALRADGTIVAWGDNSTGQLNVPAGIGTVVAVGAGRYHSQAIVASP